MEDKNKFNHISVRLEDSINSLNIRKDKIYVDCTFGRGGHSKQILNKLENTGHLYCFDQDEEAHKYFEENFKDYKNVTLIKSNFKNIKEELAKLSVFKVDGILFDLGVSSPMFDDASRGFSYKLDGKLDMRMNQNQTLSAYEVINNYSEQQLTSMFKKYGEIYDSYAVVKNICNKRKIKHIETTLELVEIIREKTPIKFQYEKKHFARKYFQAIRIEVNDEINVLNKALKDSLNLLEHEGRIVTISFHSLEEKSIKNVYYEALHKNDLPKEIPINTVSDFKIIKVKQKTNNKEIENNNRARSAYLKIIERV